MSTPESFTVDTFVDTFTVETARRAAKADRLGDWVTAFLSSPGSDNEALAAQLAFDSTTYLGLIEVNLESLVPLAGTAEDDVLVPVAEDEWTDDVDAIREQVADGWAPPPLLVSWRDGRLFIEDGNHRREALLQQGETQAWAIVFFRDETEHDAFASTDAGRG